MLLSGSQPSPLTRESSRGSWPGASSLASHASLARGGFLTIRDIWAGTAPRGHRHEKQGAWRKHHLHIIKPLVVPRGCLQLRWAAWMEGRRGRLVRTGWLEWSRGNSPTWHHSTLTVKCTRLVSLWPWRLHRGLPVPDGDLVMPGKEQQWLGTLF